MYLAKTSGNLNPRGQQPQSNLQVSTVRAFEGGLNVSDTDLNMAPKFAKVLDNLERSVDGSLSVRPGTKYVGSVGTATIVNCYYFNNFVITVNVDGEVWRMDGAGTATRMFIGSDTTGPWTGGNTEVNFTISNSDLIIVNGKDKPLIIYGKSAEPNYMQLQFLIDLASGTNVNVPIGKYVIAHSKYMCIAGVGVKPSTIYISATGTSGTYPGDAPS